VGTAFRVPVKAAAATGAPSFPPGVELYRQGYKNWAGEIEVDNMWTCTPRTPADVVAVVQWADATSTGCARAG
jgi:hypothetical protein